MKSLFFVIASIVVLSCSTVEEIPYTPKILVFLVDISGSTNNPAMRTLYVSAFRDALRTVRDGDAVVVGLITEKSVAELHFPVNMTFPEIRTDSDNSLVAKGHRMLADSVRAALKDSLVMRVDSLVHFSSRKVARTDIISSLVAAERCFKNYPHSRRTLVILSDMIEESGRLNFLREHLTESRRVQIIRSLDRNNRLADLRDVRVYVIGASAPDLTRYYDIRDFWLELFRAAGAVLRPEDYGSALVRINDNDVAAPYNSPKNSRMQ